eukprot:TRINITY_DN2097_c0_g2_i5.p1 TRINITY_DN2097_c0_g2~~TRINITY_DN2097_c0_g2_i5.p1  ORF type:complete len:733 (+),score=171.68 TRINITY_DN2097_c0_g2_i5:375-2573(+)
MTEKQYVKDLQVMVKVFLRPIQLCNLLSKPDLACIFMNLEPLCELHEQMLKQLEEIIPEHNTTDSSSPDAPSPPSSSSDIASNSVTTTHQSPCTVPNVPGDTQMGTVFLSLANFLKLYTPYCNGYKASLERFSKCEKENSLLMLFIKACEQKPECNGLHFRDYLIKPIQRLCKYPLLFKELLSVTPPSFPDYNVVFQTCEKVNSITQSVNENAAEVLNFEKLSLFNKTVTGYEADIGSFWHIRDEILFDSISGRNRHVYLMTHAIIVTKLPVGMIGSKKEKFLFSIDLIGGDVKDGTIEHEFQIIETTEGGEKQSFKFVTPGLGSKTAWMCDIHEAIQQAMEDGYKSPRNVFHVVTTNDPTTSENAKNRLKLFRKKITNKQPTRTQRYTETISREERTDEDLSEDTSSSTNTPSTTTMTTTNSTTTTASAVPIPALRHHNSSSLLQLHLPILTPSNGCNNHDSGGDGMSSTGESPRRRDKHKRHSTLVSARSAGSIPLPNDVQLMLTSTPGSTQNETQKLRKQVKKLKTEKAEWLKREQILLKRIENLEKQSQQQQSPQQQLPQSQQSLQPQPQPQTKNNRDTFSEHNKENMYTLKELKEHRDTQTSCTDTNNPPLSGIHGNNLGCPPAASASALSGVVHGYSNSGRPVSSSVSMRCSSNQPPHEVLVLREYHQLHESLKQLTSKFEQFESVLVPGIAAASTASATTLGVCGSLSSPTVPSTPSHVLRSKKK